MDIFKSLTQGIKFSKPASKRNVPPKRENKAAAATTSSKTVDDLFGGLVHGRNADVEEDVPDKSDDEIEMDTGEDDNVDSDVDNDSDVGPLIEFVDEEDAKEGEEEEEEEEEEEPRKIQLFSGAEFSADVFQPKQKRKKRKLKDEAQKQAQIRREEMNHLRNQHNIHVQGSDVPDPVSSFWELKERFEIDSKLFENIQKMNYFLPTPIQMQALPTLLQKRDVLASAPTGSGKTAAFVIPILHWLKEPKDVGCRAVVVSPTRELAKQTYFEIERLGAGFAFRVHLLEDVPKVVKKFKAKADLAKRFDVLVTTPNRLVFLLKSKVVDLKNVEWLVIDESDKLFEADVAGGFRDQLAVIYNACSNANVHRALFSATFATEVEEWCKLNLDNVVGVSIGARNSATSSVDQKLVFVGNEVGKIPALRTIFQTDYKPPVLIFVQTKQKAKELYRQLAKDVTHVDVIHSDRDQQERDEVVSKFRAGTVWTLIATEVLGRGIDFKGVKMVINYDFPLTSISYIHRIGRTGRAGQSGRAITLFTEKDAPNLRSIASVMKRSGCEVPEFMLQLKSASG